MPYLLLTGATGLLGNYLMRDLLQAGQPLAVLVRGTRWLTARQRIEQQLQQWDKELGQPLPRPVVLTGDLGEDDLGLDANQFRWIAEHCSGVIHNAASLTFHATSTEGEPYRSNVDGTRRMLDLCKQLGIRQFHHVSTAYVAGLRNGRVLESDVNVGQTLGNDYEKSKLAAEELVRSSDFLNPPTVYRPGIIIGDSQTGFTTTYHGFYAALQLTNTIVRTIPIDETGLVGGKPVRLALAGNETKHLVPVDWVSAVMARVILKPEYHGRTYHLTPRHPVTSRLLRDVLEESIGFYGARLAGASYQPDPKNEPEQIFIEHIRVYNSYWRMDPEFDRQNTEEVSADIPCPVVDRRLLNRLSRIVIDQGFPTPPKKRKPEVEFDAHTWLQPWLDAVPKEPMGQTVRVGLNVLGSGGGHWQVLLSDHQVVSVLPGLPADSAPSCQLDIRTLQRLAASELSWRKAWQSGLVTISAATPSQPSLASSVEPLIESLDQLLEQPVIG
jgi:nucleoside-diphosphate-sugar epimerase